MTPTKLYNLILENAQKPAREIAEQLGVKPVKVTTLYGLIDINYIRAMRNLGYTLKGTVQRSHFTVPQVVNDIERMTQYYGARTISKVDKFRYALDSYLRFVVTTPQFHRALQRAVSEKIAAYNAQGTGLAKKDLIMRNGFVHAQTSLTRQAERLAKK